MNISKRLFLLNFFFSALFLISNKESKNIKKNFFVKKKDLKNQIWFLSIYDY